MSSLQHSELSVLVFSYLLTTILGFTILLGLRLLFYKNLKEDTTRLIIRAEAGLLAALTLMMIITYLIYSEKEQFQLTPWFKLGKYHFDTLIVIDHYSIIYGGMSGLLIPLIIHFSIPYLHRESGYHRFFFLLSLLTFGLILVSYSGNFDVLFIGWELIGVASIFLIGFFTTNLRSIQNSLRAATFYRICDVGMLTASAGIHKYFHTSSFSEFESVTQMKAKKLVSFLILFATLAKSAQLPMSTWLYRAMEGPTSSSAIFYGALSIHLGPFLLLRTAPLWMDLASVRIAIGIVGGLTALFATLVGRTRSDVKTALAFATMAQIGIIYLELAFGFSRLATLHLVCHALLRTWQYLRSSSVFSDFQANSELFAGFAEQQNKTPWFWESQIWPRKLYIHALNVFYLDSILQKLAFRPFIGLSKKISKTLFPTGKLLGLWSFAMSFSTALFLALQSFGLIETSLSPEQIYGLACLCIGHSLLFAGIGVIRNRISEIIFSMIASQCSLIIIAGLLTDEGYFGARILFLGSVVSICFLLLSVFFIKQRCSLQLARYNGLAQEFPRIHIIFLVSGLSLIGIPGSFNFIGEDFALHALLDISHFLVFGYSMATALNGVAFFRMYTHIWLGRPDTIRLDRKDDLNVILFALCALVFVVTIGLGMFPQAPLGFLFSIRGTHPVGGS